MSFLTTLQENTVHPLEIHPLKIHPLKAVLFNGLLQMTLFISLLRLDLQRKYANRIDILCCMKMTSEYKVKQDYVVEQHISSERKTIFERFFEKYYIPFILKKPMKIVILGLVCTMRLICNPYILA